MIPYGFKPAFAIRNLVSEALLRLPPNLQKKPWTQSELNHGVYSLTSEEALDSYLAAYGEMHSAKLEFAFTFFPKNELTKPFEIYDWGCGQGLASLEFIYYLRKNNLTMPSRVTLIEPSEKALERASLNIKKLLSNEIEIRELKMLLPCEQKDDNEVTAAIFSNIYQINVHLFSNIIDIANINLKTLAEYITSQSLIHYIVCVGPCNVGESRINAFTRYFNINQSHIFANLRDTQFGHLKNGHPFTCTIKGFRADCHTSNVVLRKFKYYPPVQYHCGYRPDVLKDDNISQLCSLKFPYCFEILAPFDFAASTCSNPDPVLAVLSNMISRGLPTKASPFLERLFVKHLAVTKETETLGNIQFVADEEKKPTNEEKTFIAKVSLSVARVQKAIVEAMRFGFLPLQSEWNVLAIENDVPCCSAAFYELKQMFDNITKLSENYSDITFPKINLHIVSKKYNVSPFHEHSKIYSNIDDIDTSIIFDILLDISFDYLKKSDTTIFTRFKTSGKCLFIIRSSEIQYSNREIVTTERIRYRHVIEEENTERLRYFLQLLFRKKDFRPGQLPILDRALRLESVIGLLPTGGGKSLTYQLAAMLQPGVTLVVDPIMSLMKDQYDGLIKNGIDYCSFINSTLDAKEKEHRSAMLVSSELLFIFMSPERLCIQNFRIRLKDMAESGVFFSYGVIDEVHCVSEWGHDFRFSYLHLGRTLYNYVLPKRTDGEDTHISLFGLTATASFDVLADVERELSGNNAFPLTSEATVRYENTNRLELQYRVIKISPDVYFPTKWDIFEYKAEAVVSVIKNILYDSFKELSKSESIRKIKERFIERENITDNAVVKEIQSANLLIDVQSHWYSDPNHNSGAIVFCPHRTGTIGVIDKTKQGILSRIKNNMCCDVSSFIGGDSTVSQDDFINNKTGIMVATKAFGMGIDKQNIRFTVNVNHSGSPEAFVQEAGRAGRDRKMALAVILYSGVTQKGDDCTVDFDIHKFFYNNNFLGKETEKIILYYIMEYMTVWHNDISDSFEDKPGKVTQGLLRTIDMIPDNKEEIFYISYTLLNDFDNINNFIASCNSERENNIKPLTIDNYYNAISKAIYRMCLIGVIKDFTQDYTNKLFRLVVKKLPKNMYYNQLANLLTRYYGKDRAYNEAEKAKGFKGNNEIQRCLGFLTDFIYNKIAGKRWQAILDIEELCRIATENSDWLEANEQIKDHLYYYFNSKFARNQYVAPNGENFSLTEDTDRGRISSFAIVKKYLRVIDDEICADGSPKDNIKHLHGAVRLIRRALMEPNPALNLLNIFCIYYLNPNPDERQQKDIENNYIQCVQTLYKSASCVDECTNELKLYLKELGSAGRGIVDDNTILMLENLMYAAIAYSHIQKCQIIFDKFLKI